MVSAEHHASQYFKGDESSVSITAQLPEDKYGGRISDPPSSERYHQARSLRVQAGSRAWEFLPVVNLNSLLGTPIYAQHGVVNTYYPYIIGGKCI
jgi:hypothetical protein